jgi:hypothetical protein
LVVGVDLRFLNLQIHGRITLQFENQSVGGVLPGSVVAVVLAVDR